MHLPKSSLVFVALILAACQADVAETPTETTVVSPPNILLIVVDDMGLTDIGAFGSEISTPNIDDLAYAGVRLTNYHASPVCAPTRSMLMSGSDNHKAGMGSMFGANFIKGGFGDRPGYEQQLHPRVATLPERLGDAGYHTYMAGKWHLGEGDDEKPTAKGFDKAFALMRGSASHMEKRGLGPNIVYREDGEPLDKLPEGFYSTNTYTEKLIDYIGSNLGDGKPFFGYLALTSPHWPMQVPPEFIDRYAGKYDDGYDVLRQHRAQRAAELGVVPDVDPELFELIGKSWDELSEEEQRYSARKMEIFAAMVENMDYNVGRLLGYLKQTGEFDNTFIFFMSDNGAESDREDMNPTFARGIERSNYYDNSYENLGKASSWVSIGPGWAQASTAPYRLFKGFATEGGNKVTAFAYHPTLASSRNIDDQYLSVMDVMPTFLELAGAEFDPKTVRGRPVEPMDGRSFMAIFQEGSAPVYAPDDVIPFELHGQRSLRRGDWKIVWEQRPANIWWDDEEPAHWNSWRLYNLADDPTEQNDLADAEPELLAELAGLWHQWAEEHHVMEDVTPYWPEPRNN
jgi:arylsulfatase